MRSDSLLNLLFLPIGIIVILDLLSLFLYFKWMRSGEIRKIKYLLLFKPFSTVVCIYFMFTQFGAGFSWGAAYHLMLPVATLIMFMVFLVQLIKLRKEFGFPSKNYIIKLMLGALIAALIALPFLAYSPIKEMCATSNSAKIPVISQAMDKFFTENGKYPKQLGELVPDYISSLPTPSCAFLFGFPSQFRARVCEGYEPMIYVATVDGMGYDLYNFRDGRHFRIHSFLDNPDPGYCP